MEFTESLIRNRRSVRTFDARPLEQEHLDKLTDYLTNIPNPYGLPIEFRLLNSRDRKLSCPVAVGAELFVGGKMKATPDCCVAFGYSFEKLVLYAQSLGIGTVWVGGTMDRGAFEKAMELSDGEVMPAVDTRRGKCLSGRRSCARGFALRSGCPLTVFSSTGIFPRR